MDIDLLQSRFLALFTPAELTPQEGEWGWRIPAGVDQATRIGYATTLSPDVVLAAHHQHIHLIVTHHDAWDFLYELRDESYRLLDDLCMAHLYVHAPLDGADFGTSAALLKRVGGHELGKFDQEGNMFWGRYGAVESPAPFEAFTEQVSGLLGEKPRMALPGSGIVQRVAILTGAGCSTKGVQEAAGLGCDTYITGEMNLYFLMYARHKGMNTLVYSHTATEIGGVEALVRKLVESVEGIQVIRLDEANL